MTNIMLMFQTSVMAKDHNIANLFWVNMKMFISGEDFCNKLYMLPMKMRDKTLLVIIVFNLVNPLENLMRKAIHKMNVEEQKQ